MSGWYSIPMTRVFEYMESIGCDRQRTGQSIGGLKRKGVPIFIEDGVLYMYGPSPEERRMAL